jgi:hypothetical protein
VTFALQVPFAFALALCPCFENGKSVEDWLFYNGSAFAAQLGIK